MEAKDIRYLFHRPLQSLSHPRGYKGKEVIFKLQNEREYKSEKTVSSENDESDEKYRMIDFTSDIHDDISKINLDSVLTLDRSETFSPFIPKHQAAVESLLDLFMNFDDFDKFFAFAAHCHDLVNPDLFIYALSVTMMYREDLKNFPIPLHWQTFPQKFFNPKTLQEVENTARSTKSKEKQIIVEIPTDVACDPEHRLAYWREDIGVNLHHWHWHLLYPPSGNMKIVDKDRRGELFYYMHNQILTRYNTERFCNDLPATKKLTNWREPIETAYFPKLTTFNSGENWPSRPAGLTMQDVARSDQDIHVSIDDLKRWRNRLYDAVHSKYAINKNGEKVELDEVTGIDILGNMMESNSLSINRDYYGHLHSSGHNVLGFMHDPTGCYKEPMGVINSEATAMRDPIFYEWHSFINDILTEFKDSLKPYTNEELNFDGITVTQVEIRTTDEAGNYDKVNNVNTYWKKDDIDLTRGLDFKPMSQMHLRFTHLDHDEFEYHIEVANESGSEKYGTVRIFASTVHEFNFNDQRKFMFEMDKFVILLKEGRNVITRKASESAVTIPFNQTFRDLSEEPSHNGNGDEKYKFCLCGWPQHMLLPKGTADGFPMQLFVMISNYEDDKVAQPKSTECKIGVDFCGLKDLKYPDKRSMGYPLDRKAPAAIRVMNDFLKPNMKTTLFNISHLDLTKEPVTIEATKRLL